MTAFKVKVQLSWGPTKEYLIANDVEPGLQHRYETRKHWQNVMDNALINVPVAPYLPSNKHVPPIATGRVIKVTVASEEEMQLLRTRSQFIMADIWQKHDTAGNYNFLHHDYEKWTQRQIYADVDYWCTGAHHPIITWVTRQRIKYQWHLYNQETAR
ncbi:hypothetical protein FD27_GL001256 [Limosilactobacillus frumenti DSM 13145]|uniref:Uncharacterized protein n=1 Tax=Limosilactobacillus frumenti DSM 13145 TaxID=1423746 RepID=A0A0R1P281_9LACO|nr:hypothetical protein [Limosilactobacillus frumenti]KRL26577.1 hypothetical protein FD27_GL001256 [Limosilactobacillus frumenti DSM 13145]MBA2914116.1 hypothetical protein [Limosilactobacillus frumenti]QFG72242.1 hypothetical protein LF145_02195 [Limosilactobacillus frumenti]